MKEIFVDTHGPGLPSTYEVDLEAGTVGVRKENSRGTVWFQTITSASRIKRVLKRARAARAAKEEAADAIDDFNYVGSRHHY